MEKKAEDADFSTFFVKIVYMLAYVHIFLYLCAFFAKQKRNDQT